MGWASLSIGVRIPARAPASTGASCAERGVGSDHGRTGTPERPPGRRARERSGREGTMVLGRPA